MKHRATRVAALLLGWPRTLLFVLLALGALLALHVPRLAVEVSPATLIAPDDASVAATRLTAQRFQLPEVLQVTVATGEDFTSASTRALLDTLQKEIAAVPGVARVDSILDAPLLAQVPGPLARLAENRRTLRDAGIDLAAARRELLASPLFHRTLTGADGRFNVLRVSLRDAPASTGEDPAPRAVAGIRAVLAAHRDHARLGLVGAAPLAEDASRALDHDLRRLPLCVLGVMVLVIGVGTRRPPVLEFTCGAYATVATAGLWQVLHGTIGMAAAAALPLVTVVAVSLAFTLRVSYKLHAAHGDPHCAEVLNATVAHAMQASLPASGVLLVLGATLCLSPLVPLHDLGLLLLAGLGCAWLGAFGVGATMLAVVRRRPQALTPFALAVPARGMSVALALVLAVALVGGLPRFIDEAALRDYFRADSQAALALAGMNAFLGGTLELDLVVSLPAPAAPRAAPPPADSPLRTMTADDPVDTWFTAERLRAVRALHAELQVMPGAGHVASLATLLAIGRQVNGDVDLAPFDLNLLYKRLPRAVRTALVDPFVQPREDTVRFTVRMHDLPPGLTRSQALAQLARQLETRHHLAHDQYRLSGSHLVYAEFIDRLPPSLVVLGALGALSSLALVILGGRAPQAASRMLTPTLIAALGVLGVAGWHGYRVDLMTVCASGVAFALFVQIRNAGRQLVDQPAPESLRAGTAPPPVRDPYGATVIALGTMSMGAGLFTLLAAEFPPTLRFGLLCGATVTLAMLASQRVAGRRRRAD